MTQVENLEKKAGLVGGEEEEEKMVGAAEPEGGGGGKEIITQGDELKTVKDVVKYFKNNKVQNLVPDNWQYYNCMIAEFRKNVGDHHELGWENMTKEYYDSLEKMSDDSRKKSFEIHRKYRNIFENFVQAKNGKCPDGFEYNKSLGGCMPVGPKLNNLDFPLDGDLSK